MRRGIGLGIAWALALAGCREIVHDPAGRQSAPIVHELDAQVDEDAAIPAPPIPDWALDGAPPPAFPPPR